MWPFSKPVKLLRLLDRLAFYNDKGSSYARHTPSQVELERALRMAQVKCLIAAIGPESLPSAFLTTIKSGSLAEDLTGQYSQLLRVHFRHRRAP